MKKVIIIEDSPTFCNMLGKKLEAKGWKTMAQFKFSVASPRGANQRWCIHDTGRTGCPQCHAAVL